ncbi:hypothetical protein MBENS4_1151 [Novosphingobium sp. MBES04]|nr:hypothetical protein MBENS4_1151 [Novosphingobium sp. MBES04]
MGYSNIEVGTMRNVACSAQMIQAACAMVM